MCSGSHAPRVVQWQLHARIEVVTFLFITNLRNIEVT